MKRNTTQSGFTLIEVIIATMVFVVVVTIGITAVLNVNNNYRKSKAQRAVIDNMTFVVEDMTRNIRLGTKYQCLNDSYPAETGNEEGQDCDINGKSGLAIAFESYDRITGDPSDQIVYRFITDNDTGRTRLEKSTAGGADGTFSALTPPEIDISVERSGFWVVGSDSRDARQPKAIIQLYGSITEKGIDTPFYMQTTVSQRVLDIQ